MNKIPTVSLTLRQQLMLPDDVLVSVVANFVRHLNHVIFYEGATNRNTFHKFHGLFCNYLNTFCRSRVKSLQLSKRLLRNLNNI